MNLPRLRELHTAWRDGAIRAAEDDVDDAVYDYERGEWLGGEHSITRYGMFVQGFMHALLRAR